MKTKNHTLFFRKLSTGKISISLKKKPGYSKRIFRTTMSKTELADYLFVSYNCMAPCETPTYPNFSDI